MKSETKQKDNNLEIPDILHEFLEKNNYSKTDIYEIAYEDVRSEAYFVLTDTYLHKVNAQTGKTEEEIKLCAISKAEIKSMVGGGIFEIYLDKVFKEVSRFSNARMKSFGRIAKLVNEYIKNKEIKDEGGEEGDILCQNCKRPLPDRDSVCRFCLKKGKVLLRFLGFLKPYKFTASLVCALLVFGLIFSTLNPQFIKFILNTVFLQDRVVPDKVLQDNDLSGIDVFGAGIQDIGDNTYVVLTGDDLVIIPLRTGRILEKIPLAKVTESRVSETDTGGVLELWVDGQRKEISSFSKTHTNAFKSIAGHIDQYIKEGRIKRKTSVVNSFVNLLARIVYSIDHETDLTTKYWRGRLLWLAVGMMVLLWFFEAVFAILKGRLGTVMGSSLVKDLRSAIFNHLQKLSFSFYDKRQTGALMARVAHDTERLQNFIMQALFHFLPSILILVIVTFILFVMNWKLTLWILVPAPLIFFGTLFFWKKFIGLIHRYFGARARLGAEVNDAISGIRVVRAFGQEEKSIQRFEEKNYEVFSARIGFERYIITVFTAMGYLSHIGFFFIYIVGGSMVLNENLSIGEFIAFTMYLGMFLGPLRMLSRMGEWLSNSLAAAQRVFDVLDTEPEIKSKKEGVELTPLKGDVTFEDVTFGYEPFKPVLKGVSIDVKAGEMIGLVGESGVGKTTITNLVCRFYDVPDDAGKILIDGVPIKDILLDSLRKQIGIVLQEPFLFSGTIAENIAYPKPHASLDEIISAAKAANAHDFIMKFNDGYETHVGERGGRLSGGEKQRISIARAILHDPRILILDEATSSVDTKTEKEIQEALSRLTKGRTTFAIAHRLSTLRNADRLVVIDKGEVAEIGTHDELIEKKGVFWKLVKLQRETSEVISIGG